MFVVELAVFVPLLRLLSWPCLGLGAPESAHFQKKRQNMILHALMRSQTPPHKPPWPQGTHHSSMTHAYTPMKPYFVISGHFGAKMRILSSKSHISTKKLMRTKIFFKKKNPEPPGGPQGSLRRSLTHMHTPATAHQRPFSVIFPLQSGVLCS